VPLFEQEQLGQGRGSKDEREEVHQRKPNLSRPWAKKKLRDYFGRSRRKNEAAVEGATWRRRQRIHSRTRSIPTCTCCPSLHAPTYTTIFKN
jgi:hypothetical protein